MEWRKECDKTRKVERNPKDGAGVAIRVIGISSLLGIIAHGELGRDTVCVGLLSQVQYLWGADGILRPLSATG